jgi:hypothetical protein
MRARAIVAIGAAMLGAAGPAIADPALVMPADDTRTHAIASRRWFAAWASWARLRKDDTNATWFQVGLGPSRWKLPFRGARVGEKERWTLRGRFGFITDGDADTTWGPLTLAAQRITVHEILAVPPMIHVQSGIEIAVSTPWLSDRRLDPAALGATAYSADTELAGNGWSLRPATVHARFDVLVCRSLHAEVGAGPEVFRSTLDPARGIDIGVRWRFSVGFSLACPARPTPLADITVSLQYNARALLYNRAADPTYDDALQFALQWQLDAVAIAAFSTVDARIFGLRMELELGDPDS